MSLGLLLLGGALGACEAVKSPVENEQADAELQPNAAVVGDTSKAVIALRSAVRFQTITGWEAHAQAGFESPDYHLFANTLLQNAVNDLGINRVRLEIKSGAENTVDYYQQFRRKAISDSLFMCVRFATVNDNADPNVINWNGFKFSALDSVVQRVIVPMRNLSAARGEKLFINLEYVAFTDKICGNRQYHHDDSPQEYAEFILATSLHLRNKYGITPDSWEVILEPDNTPFWRGPQIGRAIVAAAAKLSANGFTPRFIAPSTARSFNAVPYFDQMIAQVPAAKPYLKELSYHRYSSPTNADLQTIAARAAQHGIKASMLEKIKADYVSLHTDLKFANVTAWQQFALAFGATDDGSQYYTINRTNPSSPKVVMASRTKLLRQYFKWIRAGAVRIDATSSNAAVAPLAFINTNGKYVVVIKSGSSSRLAFGVQSLPAGTYGLTSTTSSGVTVNGSDITIAAGQTLNSFVPAKSVMTVYRK